MLSIIEYRNNQDDEQYQIDAMTNRVLVLTTVFPPDNNGRATALKTRLKYLIRNYDWMPVVIVGHESFDRKTMAIEGEDIPVYRSVRTGNDDKDNSVLTTLNPLKYQIHNWLTPDHYIVRMPNIIKKVKRVIDKEDIDTIYTMCYPFTFHLVGLVISRQRDVGWLAEFRDPWVTNPNHFDGDGGLLQQSLERWVVRNCDQIVYNYGIQVPENYFKETYAIPDEKVTMLDCPGSCGFDFETLLASSKEEDHFTIVYGGSFYGNGHSPEVFLHGLGKFVRCQDLDASDVTVDFYGDWSPNYNRISKEAGVDDIVHAHGWVDYNELLESLQKAHVALFIVRPFPGDELNVPQKIVDYVVTETPMLVLAGNDWEVSEFTRREEVGIVAEPDDSESVSSALDELYEVYKQDNLNAYTASDELLSRFDAQTQTQQFVHALDETL